MGLQQQAPTPGRHTFQVYPVPVHHAALILWRVTTAGRELGRYNDDTSAVQAAMREARRTLQEDNAATAVVSVARLDGSVRSIHMTAFAPGA
jgi:hypothetical protein